jgi:hypothetical protein
MNAPTQQPARAATHTPVADDGTRALLRTGFWILFIGALAGLATLTLFGGIGIYGPHTNLGWIALILCMMNCPFGLMLFLLGAAKWLRNRRQNRPILDGETP